MSPQVREVNSEAPWRSDPLSHAECIFRILRSRGKVSPLLTAPWVKICIFRMDWLHVADLGVAADFIGNFLGVINASGVKTVFLGNADI